MSRAEHCKVCECRGEWAEVRIGETHVASIFYCEPCDRVTDTIWHIEPGAY